MYIVNFIIAVVALIIAVMALRKPGSSKDFREVSADALAKMERRLRKVEGDTAGEGKGNPPASGPTL